MKIVGIIESKCWRHVSGASASIYGSIPWTGAPGNRESDWTMEVRGFTWEMSNGTVGFGRTPAKTREEAEEVMRKFNARGRQA